MNKIVSVFCAFSIMLVSFPAYSNNFENAAKEGIVTNIKKGEIAPFEGVLLSTPAAAKLFGNLKFCEDECKLTIAKNLEISNIKHNADLSSLKLKLDVEITRTESLLKIKNERIEFLEKNWRPPAWYESGEFWLAVGIVSGVLITVGAGHAINSAN